MVGPFRPKQNHKAIGERSEAIIIAKLLEVGYGVLTPFGDNGRYDLVIEDADGNFFRIQCKTGWIESDGAYIEFATASTYYHTRAGRTGYGRKDYRGQVDYFTIYCPETKGCTWYLSTMWERLAVFCGYSQQKTIRKRIYVGQRIMKSK